MVLAGQLLHIKGAGRDLGIGWRYNSLNDARPTLSVGASEAAVTVGADSSVTYTAPDGGTYKFVPAGAGAVTMPPGLNATITNLTSTAVTIRFNDTGYSNDYAKVGSVFRLVSENDQNPSAPNKITYTYDTAGLLTSITDTIGGRPVTFSYDDPNNPEQPSQIHDDAEVRDIWFEYNGPGGAMSEITDANGEVMIFGYGAPSNRVTTITDDTNIVTTLGYDGTSKKLIQAKYATGTTVQSVYGYAYPSGTLSKGTDPLNRDTTYEYNSSGQVTIITDALGHTTKGSFDGHDNRLTSLNGLGHTTTYAYNANNSLTKITNPAGGAAGAETTFAYPSNTGNPLSNYQPTSSVSSENQTTTYSYDAATNNRYQTTTPGAGGGAGGTPKLNYQGDAAGTTCGAKKGQVCKSTDGNGNLTSYTYGALGMPTTITYPAPLGAVTNSYYDSGRLLSSTDGKGQVTDYYYDGNDRLVEILNGTLGITRQTTGGASTSFIRDPGGTLISMRTSAGASFYYTTDALGSVILLTDSAQNPAATYAYDSWGQTTTATGTQAATNPWTYAGGYNDTTSNRIKYGARYYNPYRGRFTQPDPSDQETNRYAYAGANPTNHTDSTGLDFWSDLGDQLFPAVVQTAVTTVGSLLGVASKSIGVGLGISAVVGCGAGWFGLAAEDRISGVQSGTGAYVGACIGGAIGGLTGSALLSGVPRF